MKKAVIKFIKIVIPLVIISLILGYFFLIKIPSNRIESLANQFEVAVRNSDKSTIDKVISPNRPYWERLDDKKMFLQLQEHFGRFYKGIEVYKVYPSPLFNTNNEGTLIWSLGRMRAKVDNRYRDWFEIAIEKVDGEWRLATFYFPDYVDY